MSPPDAAHELEEPRRQILLFVQGHHVQGLLRLIPVAVFGLIFPLLALWRKSPRPGMIAHGRGDGFGPIMFFLRLFQLARLRQPRRGHV